MPGKLDCLLVTRISRRGRLIARAAVPVLLALAAAVPATAQRELFPVFSVRAGAYVLTNETTIGLSGGESVDLERDFGLGADQTLASLWLDWQPAKRHLFRLGYYQLSLDGSRRIDRTIDWGDVTYPAGANVSVELEQTVYEVDWTWWLVRGERGAFGTALGATVLEFSASADAQVRVGNSTRDLHEEASSTAPVPTIGLAARAQPFSQLWLDAEVRILPGVQFDTIEGDAMYVSASAEWQALRHLSLGLNWTGFEVDATVDDSRFDGDLDFTNSGTQLYARFIF